MECPENNGSAAAFQKISRNDGVSFTVPKLTFKCVFRRMKKIEIGYCQKFPLLNRHERLADSGGSNRWTLVSVNRYSIMFWAEEVFLSQTARGISGRA